MLFVASAPASVKAFGVHVQRRIPDVALDWARRVVANGGAAVSAQTLNAVGTFAHDCTKAGIAEKMVSACCFAPDNLTACITPLYKTAGNTNDPWTNTNFVAGDLTVNGLKGDGASKRLDTGVVPSTAWPINNTVNKNASISLYVYDGNNEVSIDFGALAGGENFILRPSYTGNSELQCYTPNNSYGLISVANSNWQGFIIGSRSNGSRLDFYDASSTVPFNRLGFIAANYQDGTTLGNSMYVFQGNGLAQPSSKRFSFAHLGGPFSEEDCRNLYNAVQRMRIALGGGFR